MTRETVVKWVGTLLLKAADPGCTEAERASCQEKAEALMKRYKIERAEADKGNGSKKSHIVDVVMQGCDYGSWQHLMAHHLSTVFETMWIFTEDKKFQVLVGQKEDVKSTMELFLFLATEICNLSLTHMRLDDSAEKKEAFCLGCTMRVGERVRDFYMKVVNSLPPDCRALMVSKEGEIIKHLQEKFKQEKLSEKSDKLDSKGLDKAFLEGYKAGSSVDIAGNRKVDGGPPL